MKIAVVAALLLLSSVANAADWKKEPKDFRDVPFGAGEQDVASKLKLDTAIACLLMGDQRGCIHYGTIGDAKTHEIFQFEDDRLVQVHISFKPPHFASLRDTFIERYGKPTETWTEPFETVGGNDATNEIVEWRGDRMIIQIVKFGPSLHESLAVISTREYYDKTAEEE